MAEEESYFGTNRQGSAQRYIAFFGIGRMEVKEGEEQGVSDHGPGMVAAARSALCRAQSDQSSWFFWSPYLHHGRIRFQES